MPVFLGDPPGRPYGTDVPIRADTWALTVQIHNISEHQTLLNYFGNGNKNGARGTT